jgi:pimeloyl-ACP methyl ester carboxylesterase
LRFLTLSAAKGSAVSCAASLQSHSMQIHARNPLAELVHESQQRPRDQQILTICFADYVTESTFSLSEELTARRQQDGSYQVMTDYDGICTLINPQTYAYKHSDIISIRYEIGTFNMCPLGLSVDNTISQQPIDKVEMITANGISLECRIAGRPGKPLLVMLHGFPDTFHCFDPQIEELKEEHFIVAPNLRGYGASTKPNVGYDIRTLTDDVAGVIRNFGGRAQLIGHDWGGSIAWATAHFHPTMVSRLVVINAPHPANFSSHVFKSLQLFLSWYIFLFQVPYAPEKLLRLNNGMLIGALIRLWSSKKLPDATIELMKKEMLKPQVLESALQYYRTALRSLRNPPSFEDKVRVPVHIIWGRNDHCLRESILGGVGEYASVLHYKYLRDVGHWVTREAAAEISKELKEYLSRS